MNTGCSSYIEEISALSTKPSKPKSRIPHRAARIAKNKRPCNSDLEGPEVHRKQDLFPTHSTSVKGARTTFR